MDAWLDGVEADDAVGYAVVTIVMRDDDDGLAFRFERRQELIIENIFELRILVCGPFVEDIYRTIFKISDQQRETFALIHGQVHEDVFGVRLMNQIAQLAGGNLEILGFGLAAVDDRRDAAGFTELLGTGATTERAIARNAALSVTKSTEYMAESEKGLSLFSREQIQVQLFGCANHLLDRVAIFDRLPSRSAELRGERGILAMVDHRTAGCCRKFQRLPHQPGICNRLAIVRVGNKQYRVEKGDTLLVDRVREDEGSKLDLEPLLFRSDETVFDSAELEKVKVEAAVVGHERGKKIHGLKFKPKRGYKRRFGARADLRA